MGFAFAENLNVLVYPSDAEISSYIQAMLPKAKLDGSLLEKKLDRSRIGALKEKGEKLDQAYRSENENSISDARKSFSVVEVQEGFDEPFDVSLISPEGTTFDSKAIVSGDVEYLRFICLESGADVLVVPLKSKVGGFNHLSLYKYIFGEDGIRLVFERVSADSDMFTPSSMIRLSEGLLGGNPTLIRLDHLVDGASVSIDGNPVLAADGHILTTEGRHVISLSALGHYGRSFAIDALGNAVSAVDASLESMRYSDLKIDTTPTSNVSIDGSFIGQTPLVLPSYSLPLSIRFEQELYMGRTVGLTERTDSLSLALKPKWMASEEVFKGKKDSFYWAFARSFLIFGAKLALGVFNDGSSALLSSLDIVSNGILTVSVVDAVSRLVDYYRQTEYISP